MKGSRIGTMLRAALALAAALCLVSCGVLDYIFGSVFPATVMLAKAQADLSGTISADDAEGFQVRVVETSTGYGYVVLTGNPPSGPVAYFYDLDLNPKATLTSTGVMADASGNIALGTMILNPANLSILVNPNSDVVTTPTETSGSRPSNGNDGFVVSVGGALTNFYRFSVNSFTIGWATYGLGAPWPSISAGTGGATLSSNSGANLQFYAILDDGNPSGSTYFVMGPPVENDIGRVYFISGTKQSNLTIPTNAFDSAPSRDHIEVRTLGFANGSIFAYDQSAASFLKINPADGSIEKSFYSATDAKDTRFAYRANGGSFYGFDSKTRILTKYGSWW